MIEQNKENVDGGRSLPLSRRELVHGATATGLTGALAGCLGEVEREYEATPGTVPAETAKAYNLDLTPDVTEHNGTVKRDLGVVNVSANVTAYTTRYESVGDSHPSGERSSTSPPSPSQSPATPSPQTTHATTAARTPPVDEESDDERLPAETPTTQATSTAAQAQTPEPTSTNTANRRSPDERTEEGVSTEHTATPQPTPGPTERRTDIEAVEPDTLNINSTPNPTFVGQSLNPAATKSIEQLIEEETRAFEQACNCTIENPRRLEVKLVDPLQAELTEGDIGATVFHFEKESDALSDVPKSTELLDEEKPIEFFLVPSHGETQNTVQTTLVAATKTTGQLESGSSEAVVVSYVSNYSHPRTAGVTLVSMPDEGDGGSTGADSGEGSGGQERALLAVSDVRETAEQLRGLCPSVTGKGGETAASATPTEETDVPQCPDDFDVPPAEEVSLRGFQNESSLMYVEMGEELVYPPIEIEAAKASYLGLDYELIGPDEEMLVNTREYYKLEPGINTVPTSQRSTEIDYYEYSLDSREIDAELVNTLRSEGAKLEVACHSCGEGYDPATASIDVKFLGDWDASIEVQEIELEEHPIEVETVTDPGVVGFPWGTLYKGRVEDDDMALYANGDQLYKAPYISNLTRTGETSFAFVRWKDGDPFEVIKYSPQGGKDAWAIEQVEHDNYNEVARFSSSQGKPVWFEEEPVQVGLEPPDYLSTTWGVLRAGDDPIAWGGHYAEYDQVIKMVGPIRDSWVINDSIIFMEGLSRPHSTGDWDPKVTVEWIGEDGISRQRWELYKWNSDSEDLSLGEIYPFPLDIVPENPDSWSLGTYPYPVGKDGFALEMYLVVDGETWFAFVSPTADWESPVYDNIRDIPGSERNVVQLANGIACIGVDKEGDREQLFWNGWTSEWAPSGSLSLRLSAGVEGLEKPVWTRNRDGRTEMFYGKEKLSDHPVKSIVPDGNDGIAYVEQRPDIADKNTFPNAGDSLERVCHSEAGECGPFYQVVEDLASKPSDNGIVFRGQFRSGARTGTLVGQSELGAVEYLETGEESLANSFPWGFNQADDWGVSFWTSEDRGLRLHLLDQAEGEDKTTKIYDSVNRVGWEEQGDAGHLLVEGGGLLDDGKPFVGAHVTDKTGEELVIGTTNTKTLPDPPDDTVTAADRHRIAKSAAERGFEARSQQILDEIAVCKEIQRTIRELEPIQGQGIAQALKLQEQRDVSDDLKRVAYNCETAKLGVQIAAPLLANLGQLIVTAVNFTSFVNGLSSSARTVINTGSKKAFQQLMAEAATEVTLKASSLVSKRLTGYSIPDPRGGDFRDVAQFWTKVALDFASEQQRTVITDYTDSEAFRNARVDLDWEVKRIQELEDLTEKFNEIDQEKTAARKAVVLEIARLHDDIQQRVEKLETENLAALEAAKDDFGDDLRDVMANF